MDLVWETESGQLEAMSFDATLREELSATALVTTYPVEGGADAADHVVPSVTTAVFECYVSDSPVEVPTSHMFGTTGAVRPVPIDGGTLPKLERGATKKKAATYGKQSIKGDANALQFDRELARRERIYEALDALRKSRTLLTATGILRTLENVVITSLGAPLEAKDGEGITFRLALTEVLFAESQIVEVPDPVEPRGRRSRDAGATATSDASAEQQQSIASRLSDLGIAVTL